MSKFAISIDWIETPANAHHTPYITPVIGDVLMLGNRMIAGRVGERLSTQKVAGCVLPPEVAEIGEWSKHHPALMRAEWAFMDDDIFMVVQKYFAANVSYHRNGVYHSAPDDFYRISGNDWSLCFNVASERVSGDYSAYTSFYGIGCSAAKCEVLTTGDFEAFETDAVLFKLMGHFSPPAQS